MEYKPKVSVIVPAYNAELYLEGCLKNILNQSYKDFELLVIDDGSKDQTNEIIQRQAELDDRVVLISQENAGASAARNCGLKEAKGDWIVFVDSDDYVTQTYLQDLIDMISDKEDVVLGVCGHSVFYNGTFSHHHQFPKCSCLVCDYKTIFQDISLHKFGFPWGKIFRRDIIERHHLRFDEKVYIAEDLMFLMHYLISANSYLHATIAFSDMYNYSYLVHQGSLSTCSSSFEKELYSYNEYRSTINQLKAVFCMDDCQTELLLRSPIAYYADRCLNTIFQRPISSDWKEKLGLIDRKEYQRYKRCNTKYESLLKFLFVHRFWYMLRLLR